MEYLEFDFTVEPLYPGKDVLVTELGELGFDSFVDTDKGVKAYIPTEAFQQDQLDQLVGDYQEHFKYAYTSKVIPFQNWNAEWESHFDPIEIDDAWRIIAPFHESKSGKKEIVIEPKMSFGTGHHETTLQMCKELLNSTVANSVLDMGAGTGVLAILTKILGSKEVVGVEIEEHAVENAKENESLNGSTGIDWLCGGGEVVPEREFDRIVANINRNILVELLPVFHSRLVTEGELWLSGFFETDIESLKIKFENHGFQYADHRSLNGWALLKFIKN